VPKQVVVLGKSYLAIAASVKYTVKSTRILNALIIVTPISHLINRLFYLVAVAFIVLVSPVVSFFFVK